MPEAFSYKSPMIAVQSRIKDENDGAIFIGTAYDHPAVVHQK
jgi:hypothetical protein